MAGQRGVLVWTASGRKQHLSVDLQITFCGHRVDRTVYLAGMDTRKFCRYCGGIMGWASIVMIVDELPKSTAPEATAEPQEAAPQPQEPQHEGIRPVRGRRRPT